VNMVQLVLATGVLAIPLVSGLQSVVPGAGDAPPAKPEEAITLDRLIDPATKPERLTPQIEFRFLEGPVWIDTSGDKPGFLLFSDIPANTIYQWQPRMGEGEDRTGAVVSYLAPSGHSNGLLLDREGRLLVCQHDRRLVRFDTVSSDAEPRVLAEKFEAKPLNSPNDLDIRRDGTVYFTDPPYGLGRGAKGDLGFNGVYRLSPDGRLSLASKDLKIPNGIVLSPDETRLYVADQGPGEIRVFDVGPDGTLGNNRLFAKGNMDGMKVDREGNLYGAGRGGVWVFNPEGAKLGVIAVEQEPANLCFGGDDRKTLFITARTGLYRVPMKVAGVP
jgi:sugar lactone lactonase YvrE